MINDAREALLRSLNEPPRSAKMATKAQQVRDLADLIRKHRKIGWTWAEIADILRGTLDVSVDTLRLTMAALDREDGQRKKRRPKASGSVSVARKAGVVPPADAPVADAKKFGGRKL